MTERDIIPVGTLLIFETGEYSDKSWVGPFRVLRDIDKYAVAEGYKTIWQPDPERSWEDEPSHDGFVPYLVRGGFIEDVPASTSWHIGSYGSFEP